MALRDENQPWRFETRSLSEMDQANPVHAREHLEFAEKAMAAILAIMELVEEAPCPGTARTLLDQVSQMTVVGTLTLHQKEQAWVVKHRAELEAMQTGQPGPQQPPASPSIPSAFEEIFRQFPGLAEGA